MRVRLASCDVDKLMRLETIRRRNFRILDLYSRYINFCSTLVDAETVSELKSGSDITDDEAVSAILSAAFELDTDNFDDDAVVSRKYIPRSVKRMDADFYKNDPYYKNIVFPDVKCGQWEMKHGIYKPYEGFIYDDIEVLPDLTEIPRLGYFTEEFTYPAVLENGREWMLVTPNEVETLRESIDGAFGRTVTFGLGLGYFAYMASLKPAVSSVTVVERDENVISLFREYILPQFPSPDKVNVIRADAYDFARNAMDGFDYALADIWHDAGDGFSMYLRFKRLEQYSPRTKWAYWIERSMLSRLRWMVFRNIFDAYKNGGGSGTAITSYADIAAMLTDDALRDLSCNMIPAES